MTTGNRNSSSSSPSSPAIILVGGTSSGVGKTTVTCGLITALTLRGLTIQPFKCGPDFLDALQHQAAIDAGIEIVGRNDGDGKKRISRTKQRKTINLDGWMMGGEKAVVECFVRHSAGADVCIIEGVMGLFDSKNGTSDDGSSAQIAKYLNASVLLVIDAGKMARSVAPMVMGYATYDPNVNLDGIIANKVGGPTHVLWIQEAVEDLNFKLKNLDIQFAGGLKRDKSVSIPERHLGLTMPNEQTPCERKDRFLRLADLIEECLNLDGILDIGRRRGKEFFQSSKANAIKQLPLPKANTTHKKCRVGVAQDEAFCFYYSDNLSLLESAGAEIIPFSPIHNKNLPPSLDALYLGGGYPELHAEALQSNVSMRRDILSMAKSGALIYAECGGMMYLTKGLFISKDKPQYKMCKVFPNVSIRMTPHMKMHYGTIQFTRDNPLFDFGTTCRGQKFHFSEAIVDDFPSNIFPQTSQSTTFPIKVMPETIIDVKPEFVGFHYNNSVASYYHLHFASSSLSSSNFTIAEQFIQKGIQCSPFRNQRAAVSFCSTATEIVFALGEEHQLAGVTSLCDYPVEARHSPRQIICRSSIDASTMTSEEVDVAMKDIQKQSANNNGNGPGLWKVDETTLAGLSLETIFVQNSCDICDPNQDDVLLALRRSGLLDKEIKLIRVAPTTLEGVLTSIQDVADSLGCPTKGTSLTHELRKRLQTVADAISKERKRPSVLSLEGLAPLCTGGNWLPDLKLAAGCRDALGDIGGARARILTWKEIQDADPDVLILSPCSASPQRTLDELHLLASEPCYWRLRCVQLGEVYIIDHGRFSRPGPRLISGVEMLATLIHEIPPPKDAAKEWADEALKYERGGEGATSPCTSKLALCFKPIFDGTSDQAPTSRQCTDMRSCVITSSTNPNNPHPEARSAHCMAMLPADSLSVQPSLLVFAGEGNCSKRLKDTWRMHLPSNAPLGACSWQWLGSSITSIADENVPSYRSNSASVVCGKDHLLVFGGWGDDNVTPLAACELLHLQTLCWTHCSTVGDIEPPPRGNPTLVYSPCNNNAILFAGWNRVQRLNDLWYLDLNKWIWNEVRNNQEEWPQNRTDHSAILWQKNIKEDVMIVYGGSVEGTGASNEIWLLQCSHQDSMHWSWSRLQVNGPQPPGRASHTASMAGHGRSASMIILGGSDAMKGCGKSGIVGDAWVLRNLGIEAERSWLNLSWHGPGVERCRHTMSVIGSDVVVWGGFNGEANIEDCITVWRGSLPSGTIVTTTESDFNKSKVSKENMTNQSVQLQERWEAEIPLRLEDLPTDILSRAKSSKLPNAMAKAMHRYAVTIGKDTYIDPASGYSVFTQLYLKRRPCCGNGCRHCPHGHMNVPTKKKAGEACDATSNPKLEW